MASGPAPAAKLDVGGGIKTGNVVDACSSPLNGTLRFNGTYEYCNGTKWIAVSGARLKVFNSSGVFVVPLGITKVWVTLIGEGGGGGSGYSTAGSGAAGSPGTCIIEW